MSRCNSARDFEPEKETNVCLGFGLGVEFAGTLMIPKKHDIVIFEQ